MKASDLLEFLALHEGNSHLEVVTGDEWLPERLTGCRVEDNLMFLEFDNAPEDIQGDEEPRGFVSHEVELIKERFEHMLAHKNEFTADKLVELFMLTHESSSSDVIEAIENLPSKSDKPE